MISITSQGIMAQAPRSGNRQGGPATRPPPGLPVPQMWGAPALQQYAALEAERNIRSRLLRHGTVDRSGSRRTVEERLMAAGIPYDQRRIALTASSAQALLAAIRSGTGVGFVSRLALDRAHEDLLIRRPGGNDGRLKKASCSAVGCASSTRREFPTRLRPAVTVIAAPCREAPAPSGVQPARSDWAFAANKHRTAPSPSSSTASPALERCHVLPGVFCVGMRTFRARPPGIRARAPTSCRRPSSRRDFPLPSANRASHLQSAARGRFRTAGERDRESGRT